tara:strand:+ start:1449 stop:1787 length:339 start_codon:yes stop_codon:yes gene_type:complete
MEVITLIVFLSFLLLMTIVLIYLLCCRCIIVDSYVNSREERLRRIRQEMEEEKRYEDELIREYIEMRRTLANNKNRYTVPKIDLEEMEEDKEHVIIVNPGGAEICIGKVITD